MSLTTKLPGMGWRPDYPDFRDYTTDYKPIEAMLDPTGVTKRTKAALPTSVDLRQWCSPVEDQGGLGSCTAQAGVALVEYYERRAFGHHIDGSRLFLYKATRNLLHWTGDTGALLRTTMAAMVLFGVPPEEYWPYSEEGFDEEPSAFCYSFAKEYRPIQYLRLDAHGTAEKALLNKVKKFLHAGLPSMFGFTVYSSISQSSDTGSIPIPCPKEKVRGGHAVVAIGYDDKFKIRNQDCDEKTTGAFLIRNSWGTGWGDGGYGWLPYEYVLKGLAVDWWTLVKQTWIDTKVFRG